MAVHIQVSSVNRALAAPDARVVCQRPECARMARTTRRRAGSGVMPRLPMNLNARWVRARRRLLPDLIRTALPCPRPRPARGCMLYKVKYTLGLLGASFGLRGRGGGITWEFSHGVSGGACALALSLHGTTSSLYAPLRGTGVAARLAAPKSHGLATKGFIVPVGGAVRSRQRAVLRGGVSPPWWAAPSPRTYQSSWRHLPSC